MEDALKWWGELPFFSKVELSRKHLPDWSLSMLFHSKTIQTIWELETNQTQ